MSAYDDIMESVMAGDLEALERFAQVVDGFPQGKDDFVSRHWITNGIDCGPAAVVAWMLAQGAPVVFEDDEGYSALHSAIERELPGQHDVMRMLIEAGADVNARGINDWTPAHMAAVRNDVGALKILRDAGADFTVRTRIDDYATPLEEAVRLGRSPEAVAFLKAIIP